MLYDYECPKCGVFESRENMLDERLKQCPTCGEKLVQLFTAAPAIFKGSGFFTTDNKKDSRVRGASGQLGQKASEIDSSNMDTFSRQRSDSKGHAKVTPTRPGPKTMEKMARDAEPS
uniref:Putative regulatory protein FmdB zinc ribbon domain-containing protein n=1 Tax=viral metagenome TaxID=1070528 RepID=A0A6M3M8B5_9ZZZZ